MPIQSNITVIDKAPNNNPTLFLGTKYSLTQSTIYDRFGIPQHIWYSITNNLSSGLHGSVQNHWINDQKFFFAVLPQKYSRSNSPSKSWAIPKLVEVVRSESKANIIAFVKEEHQEATIMAIARALPSFGMKSTATSKQFFIEMSEEPLQNYKLQVLANATRYAANLFDRPPNILRVSSFVQEAQDIANRTNISIQIWDRTKLQEEGFGGFIGVGRAANDGPAMVVLHHKPSEPTHSIAWVGKGIVYDTGGLSIKTKTGMPSMKGDMGGAGAVLAAFEAAVLLDVPYELYAVLCLAENSVGPDSTRPDDVLTMLSGKTVEVNNTDAEGRLVLADGVFWASKHAQCDTIFDIATLTGAAPVAVGSNVAALYCNDEVLEQCAVRAGKSIGELAHPLPYTPELYIHEFHSTIADMKNSVKNRANAQSACAGQFVGNHIHGNPSWLHIDIAGPAWGPGKRGTGFGVGLLLETAKNWIESSS